MLYIQSVMGCGLIFDKILRDELRGGLLAKLLRDGAGCGQGWAGGAGGADCGLN